MDYSLKPKGKSDVQFNGYEKLNQNWATPYVSNIKNEFDERYLKIKTLYEDLLDEVYWNNLIYSIKINYKPVIGNIYHLYKDNENEYILSIIAPNEWRKEHVASFKFEYTGKWIKI